MFFWKIRDAQPGFELTVTTGDNAYPSLIASFSWCEPWQRFSEDAGQNYNPTHRIITPGIVRKTIDYAINTGWQPYVKNHTAFRMNQADIKLGLDP